MSSKLIDIIATGLQEGLPHPGNKEADQPPQTILMPGMNFRGIPPQVMEKFAEEAGLPSADLPRLVAEALINLIKTKGESEIISKRELAALKGEELDEAPAEEEIAAEEPVETPVAPILTQAAPNQHQWSTPPVALDREAIAARRAQKSEG